MAGPTVVVTGATGFVGRAVCAKLAASGYSVRRVLRQAPGPGDVVVPDLTAVDNWAPILEGADAVVHLAALTHSSKNRDASAAAAFRAINVETTRRLAEQARDQDIGAVVFMSSIKVNGESSVSRAGQAYAYTPDDPPAPRDLYGETKLAAERCLFDVLGGTATRLSILRPPLVYGPGQKANMLSLMRLIKSGLPLPFAQVDNRRSLIYVDNLADAVVAALARQQGHRCYTVADVTLSTPELIRGLAQAMDVKTRLFSLPKIVLDGACRVPVFGARLSRLCGTLAVDASLISEELGWAPAIEFSEGVAATVAWFNNNVQ